MSYNGKKESDKGNEESPGGNDWWAEAIGAYTAWKYSDMLQQYEPVGILDAGFYTDHDEFAYEDDSGKITLIDNNKPNSHGTHVAGIIAANNNYIGIRGIANHSELVCSYFGNNHKDITNPEYVEYIKAMSENGVNIFNNSWGLGGFIKSKDFKPSNEYSNYDQYILSRKKLCDKNNP